jgi:acyl-CoA reductase-like NAD-dependent aldehyde dehydrogenase
MARRLTLLMAQASQEGLMAPSQVSAQDIETARAVVVFVVVSIIFWKFTLRVVLALAIAAAALGLSVLLQSMPR